MICSIYRALKYHLHSVRFSLWLWFWRFFIFLSLFLFLDAILTSLSVLLYHSFSRYLSFSFPFSSSLYHFLPGVRVAVCFKKARHQKPRFKSKATDENHHRWCYLEFSACRWMKHKWDETHTLLSERETILAFGTRICMPLFRCVLWCLFSIQVSIRFDLCCDEAIRACKRESPIWWKNWAAVVGSTQ